MNLSGLSASFTILSWEYLEPQSWGENPQRPLTARQLWRKGGIYIKPQPRWHEMMISWAFLYIHKGTIYKFIYRMWCATWTSFCWRQIWSSVSTSPGQCSQRIWCKFPRQSNSTVVLPWVYNLDMPRNILVWIESLSYKMWTKTYTSWQLKNLRPYPAIIFLAVQSSFLLSMPPRIQRKPRQVVSSHKKKDEFDQGPARIALHSLESSNRHWRF